MVAVWTGKVELILLGEDGVRLKDWNDFLLASKEVVAEEEVLRQLVYLYARPLSFSSKYVLGKGWCWTQIICEVGHVGGAVWVGVCSDRKRVCEIWGSYVRDVNGGNGDQEK